MKKRFVALFMAMMVTISSVPAGSITVLADPQSTATEENTDSDISTNEKSSGVESSEALPESKAVEKNTYEEESENGLVGANSTDDEVKTGKCGDNLTWTYKDKVLTIDGTGDMWDYPEDGSISKNFLKTGTRINEVIIHDGVTSIGNYAFAGFKSSRVAGLAEPYTRERDYAGYIRKISIPNTVTKIGKGAFWDESTSDLDLVIPGSVKSIGDFAFMGDKKSVTIENGVQSIGAYALTSIGSQDELVIPDSVQEIREYAFENSKVNKVRIPKTISAIPKGMLAGCKNLKEVYIPDNIKAIGETAFRGCTSLEKVILPNDLQSIGSYSFAETSSLKTIELPESLQSIGVCAFSFGSSTKSGLESINIPKNVSSIGGDAFSYCLSLQKLTVDENNKYYKSYDNCLYSIHAPAEHINKWGQYDGNKYMGGDYDANYTLIYVPATKTVIDFLTGNGITVDIPENAFSNCDKITSLIIPQGVRFDSSRGTVHYVFTKLTNLKDIFFDGYTKDQINVYQIQKYFQDIPLLKVPDGTMLHFKEDEYHTNDDVEGTITTKDLFRTKNAKYLRNEAVNSIVLNFTNEMAALFAQKPIERDVLTGIKSGLKGNFDTVSFMASYLLSGGNENKSNDAVRGWCKDIAMELVRETVFGSGKNEVDTEGRILQDAISETKEAFDIPDKYWETITTVSDVEREIQRNQMIDFLVDKAGESKEDATKIAEAMYGDYKLLDKVDKLSKVVGRAVSMTEVAVSVIMAREIEDNILQELMEAVPEDTYLYTGLKEIRDEAKRSFTENEILNLANDTVQSAISKGTKELLAPGSLTSIGGVVYSVAAIMSDLIPESSIEDAFKACIAMDNSVVLYQSVQKKINKYEENDISNDKELDERQQELELLFNMYLTSIHKAYTYLMSDTKYATGEKYANLARIREDIKENFKKGPISQLNYNSYLDSCLAEAKTDLTYITPNKKTYIRARAISNGNVVLSQVPAKRLNKDSVSGPIKKASNTVNSNAIENANFVSIPEKINGQNVIGLSDSALRNNTDITVLVLPDSVETIGNNAFRGCTNLAQIFLDESLKSIGSKAFSGCTSLSHVSIPASVNSIADDAFDGFNGTIYGQLGSVAETIAKKQGINFVANPKHIVNINISKNPNTVSFGLNEPIDLSGVTLSINYSDGTSEQISDGYEIAFSSPKTIGINTIQIVYNGWSCPLDVTLTKDRCKYSVHYVDEKGARIADDDEGIGTAGESITVHAKEISGYTPKEKSKTLTLGYFNDVDISYSRNVSKIVTEISLNHKKFDLRIGEKITLIAEVTPDDAKNKKIKWSTSDTQVATVDENGNVKAIGEGEAVITANAEDGSDVKAECAITVKEEEKEIDKSALEKAIKTAKVEVEKTSVYTKESINKLSTAIKAAQAVSDSANVTQEEVNAETESLTKAVKELVKKEDSTTSVTPKTEPQKSRWIQDNKGWKYQNEDKSYSKDRWQKINGAWYYFESNEYMAHDKWIGNYYVNGSGAMTTNQWIGPYYVDASGLWAPDQWKKDSIGWWYRYGDGSYPRNKWQQIDNVWYYFDNAGYMSHDKWIGNYYVKSSGAMAANEWISGWWLSADGCWRYKPRASWKKSAKGWWYEDTSGWYPVNTSQMIDGQKYKFDSNGYWVS